jgi:hypothetical protein
MRPRGGSPDRADIDITPVPPVRVGSHGLTATFDSNVCGGALEAAEASLCWLPSAARDRLRLPPVSAASISSMHSSIASSHRRASPASAFLSSITCVARHRQSWPLPTTAVVVLLRAGFNIPPAPEASSRMKLHRRQFPERLAKIDRRGDASQMSKTPLPKPPRRNSPLSAAVDLQIVEPELRQSVTRALRAVDVVHDDGELTKIPLRANPKLKSTLACYHYKGFRPLDIEINPHVGGTAFNVLEEIAHFLDHQALGSEGFGFASVDHPALDSWRGAALKSAPVRSLVQIAKKAKGFHRNRLQEACAFREIFARSYAQYVATKCNNPILLAALESDRNSGFGDILNWNDAEFEAILKVFDQLFAAKHWI